MAINTENSQTWYRPGLSFDLLIHFFYFTGFVRLWEWTISRVIHSGLRRDFSARLGRSGMWNLSACLSFSAKHWVAKLWKYFCKQLIFSSNIIVDHYPQANGFLSVLICPSTCSLNAFCGENIAKVSTILQRSKLPLTRIARQSCGHAASSFTH